MKNKGFKIIALKPLKGCNPYYLKILTENEFYYFYNNYSIDKKDKIKFIQILPDDFYRINDIDISISAIVGKNGSGKSTIIEILFRAINNLAQRQEGITADLQKIPNLKVDLFFHTDSFYKIRVDNSKVEAFGYDSDGNLNPNKLENFSLRDFFFTIAINYSHYAYNTSDLQNESNWLDGLFHKNDGYQTPLVINPMRTLGNIDINSENHLVRSRLIGNLLRSTKDKNFSFRKLTDNLEATALQLKLNKSKRESILYELKDEKAKLTEEVKIGSLKINTDEVLNKLNAVYNFNYETLNKEEYQIAFDYLIYKMVSIAIKYDGYTEYFSREEKRFNEKRLQNFIQNLVKDESHITFKLKQTLNFLRYQHLKIQDQRIDLDVLSEKINNIKSRRRRTEIVEFVPPPIFRVDILLKEINGTKTNIEFRTLSSGEKQMIYSVSSLLYHLINLNSISTRGKRTGYRFVNIVLEEIELYFHPAMQRTYIKYILESISKLELRKIRAINFCFVTHSPFILSDIPDSNILFLNDKGIPISSTENMKTFGGNIHELLAHSFFLGSGFIGEFAKEKIQSIIDFLRADEKQTKISKTRETVLQEIQIVGEPFLKEKLMEMYYRKFQKQKRIAKLKEEINRLENND